MKKHTIEAINKLGKVLDDLGGVSQLLGASDEAGDELLGDVQRLYAC